MSAGIWDGAVIAAKAITYASTLGASGAVFLQTACGALIADATGARIRRLVLRLALLSVCGGAAQIMASAASMGGDAAAILDGSLIGMVWQAGAGRAYAIRTLGLLTALAARSKRTSWLACLGAAAAATSFAWTGHARALDPPVLPILLLSMHLLSVAFWFGALAPLTLIARDGDLPRIAAAAARFGKAAVFVVSVLVAAGAALLWMLLRGSATLGNSSYGHWIILKLALVVCVLCLAAINKLWLTPRLLAGDRRALAILRGTLRLEVLLGGLIIAVTAAFTTLTGPPALDGNPPPADAVSSTRDYNCDSTRPS